MFLLCICLAGACRRQPAKASHPDSVTPAAVKPAAPTPADTPATGEAYAPARHTPTPPQASPGEAEPSAFRRELGHVETLRDAGEFDEALKELRALKQKYADHPDRDQVNTLMRELTVLRRDAQEAQFAIDQLGAASRTAVLAARSNLRSPTDAALILLRKAAAERSGPVGIESIDILGHLEDVRSIPILQARLLHELENPEMRPVLVEVLRDLSGHLEGKFLADILGRVKIDSDFSERDLADILVDALLSTEGRKTAQFDELLGKSGSSFLLQSYVSSGLTHTNAEIATWSLERSAGAGLHLQGLRGQYFAGTDHGSLILERLDPQVLIPESRYRLPEGRTENVSVRWTGSLLVSTPGEYTFTSASDDGQRLVVDGQVVIDDWNMHGVEERSTTLELSRGAHRIRVEHMQGGGPGQMALYWAGPGIDRTVIPSDHLSTPPWAGVTGGESAGVDDRQPGVIADLLLEDTTLPIRENVLQVLLPKVSDVPPTFLASLLQRLPERPDEESRAWAELLGKAYAVSAKFSDQTFDTLLGAEGAAVRLKAYVSAAEKDPALSEWASRQPVLARRGLRGAYFQGTEFENLVFEQLDLKIDIPDGRYPFPDGRKENLSIRWTGFLDAPSTGEFRIFSTSDDGQRVWIDGKLVIDNWNMQAPTEKTGSVLLTRGSHPIRIEHMQGTGSGMIHVEWEGPGVPRSLLDAPYLHTPPWQATASR